MNHRWLTMLGFFTALAYVALLLVTYILAQQHGYLVLLDLNHHGEWIVELAILTASIPLILYAMWDYWKMIEKQSWEAGR